MSHNGDSFIITTYSIIISLIDIQIKNFELYQYRLSVSKDNVD